MRIANRLPFPILLILLAIRIVSANGASRPILSEAMADPTAIPDAQGEFLEIGNPGADTLRLDSLRIEADAQSLVLRNLVLRPGGLLLICRDSQPAANGGMRCGRQWSGLSLANSRACEVRLGWPGGAEAYALPAPKTGASWENTWEESEGYRRFLLSRAPRAGGDSASPGGRNSRSVRRAERDLGITQVTWAPVRAAAPSGEGMIEVRVADGGAGIPPRAFLSLRLDADWDGVAETKLDSVAVEVPAGGEAVLRLVMGAGVRGIVRAALVAGEDGRGGAGEDEDPGNDVALLPVEPGRPLGFTEWHAAPEPGEAEWVEIRNRTADSGGI
ncbi:MAG: hypothetical protein ABI036_17200, partial [Fibrobacteria bacterium]